MRSAVIAAVLVLFCATAQAGPKKRNTARLLSGVSAGVSGGVVLAGFLFAPDAKRINQPVMLTGLGLLFVTPSLGEMYSEQYLTWGMAVRGAAAALAVYTLETQTEIVTCDTAHSSTEKCEAFSESAYPMLGIAAIAFIGGVWYDTLDAGDAADRYNREHGFTLAPSVVPTASGGMAPGMVLGGRF